MILKSVLREYVEAPRESHDWMKKLTDRQLDDALHDLNPRPRLPEKFGRHQKVGFLLGLAYPRFCFWYDMGTGKTLLSLALAEYWHKIGKMKKGIVLVPMDEAVVGWEEQIKEWNVKLPYLPLDISSSAKKWEAVAEFEEGLIIGTYPGLIHMVSKHDKKESRLKKVPTKLKNLSKGVQLFIADESTKLGNRESLSYRACSTLVKNVPIRYALAGQPFGRDPTMMFSQYKLIDDGETLGPTLELFREALFSKEQNEWSDSPYSFKYTFKQNNEPILRRMMRHRSISYDENECGDLPQRLRIKKFVRFPIETNEYYKHQLQLFRESRGNYKEMENTFLRMRQISSGFLGVKDDETGNKAEIEFTSNPKLDLLLDLLQDMPRGRKAVVFHDFIWSGKKLFSEVKKAGFNPTWIWSGTKDVRGELSRFKNDRSCEVAIVSVKKASYSLNLQHANYVFYFESPVPVIDRRQSEKRCYRTGQTRRVFQYDLLVKGSVDERILAFHKEGQDLFEGLLR